MKKENNNCLFLYAVRNEKGQWFRRKGYGGSGDTWVDDFAKARIYSRIGPARGVISFFANNYTDYPAPQLIQLEINKLTVLDEKSRIQKAQFNKKKRSLEHDIRCKEYQIQRLTDDKNELERLKAELLPLQKELDKLNGE